MVTDWSDALARAGARVGVGDGRRAMMASKNSTRSGLARVSPVIETAAGHATVDGARPVRRELGS